MLMKKVNILFVLLLGVFLIPNAVANDVPFRCKCKKGKIINDYCCESANSPTKDACCHVDGIKKHPPIWVPDDDGPVVTTPIPPLVTTPGGECDCTTKDECDIVPENDVKRDCVCQDCKCVCEHNPDANICPVGAVCSRDKECVSKGSEVCKCVGCSCKCQMDVKTFGEDPACQKDEDCQGDTELAERVGCTCVSGFCDCKMSPSQCEGGDCTADIDCAKNDDKGNPMVCECNNCSCYCDLPE